MTHFGPLRLVVDNIGFTEGPIWRRNGTLAVTSVNRGLVYQVNPGSGSATMLAEVGGGPSGLAEDGAGNLWVAQNGGHVFRSKSDRPTPAGIQRVSSGGVEDIAFGLNAPNDCAFGPDGRLWFTDPRGSSLAELPSPGRVCALDVRTCSLEVIIDGPLFPNGLAFDARGEFLYLAESARRRVLRYRVDSERPLKNLDVFASFDRGMPDGVAFDADGRLFVVLTSETACIAVLSPNGHKEHIIEMEPNSVPTNVCFGGKDLGTLFVTVARGGRVMCLQSDVPGLQLAGG